MEEMSINPLTVATTRSCDDGNPVSCDYKLQDLAGQINSNDSCDAEFTPESFRPLNPASNVFPDDPMEEMSMHLLTVETRLDKTEHKIKQIQCHDPRRGSKKIGHRNPESSDSAAEHEDANASDVREFWFIENENIYGVQFPSWEVAYNYCHHEYEIDKHDVYTPHLGIKFLDSDIVDKVHYKTTDAEYWDYACDAQFDVVDVFPEDFQKQRQLNWLRQKIFESDKARDLIISTRNLINTMESENQARLECKHDIQKQIKEFKRKNQSEKWTFDFLKTLREKKQNHVPTPVDDMNEIYGKLHADLVRDVPELKSLRILLKKQVQSYLAKLREIKRQKNINLLEVYDETNCLLQTEIATFFHNLSNSRYMQIKKENGVSFQHALFFENQLRTKRLELIGMRRRYLRYKE